MVKILIYLLVQTTSIPNSPYTFLGFWDKLSINKCISKLVYGIYIGTRSMTILYR